MNLNSAIERLYDLNVGISPLEEGAPHEKPHKPLLLLAVFDMIDKGLASPDRIPWCQGLRDRVSDRFRLFSIPENRRLNALTWLAASGCLEIWSALRLDGDGRVARECFHERTGLFSAEDGDYMAISSSLNKAAGDLRSRKHPEYPARPNSSASRAFRRSEPYHDPIGSPPLGSPVSALAERGPDL